MLPVRPIRAALLAFIAALALAEVGAGLVAGQAWRIESQHGTLSFDERWELHQLLERLRVMEDVVVAGVVATTLLWMALAVHNAIRGARGSVPAAMVVRSSDAPKPPPGTTSTPVALRALGTKASALVPMSTTV